MPRGPGAFRVRVVASGLPLPWEYRGSRAIGREPALHTGKSVGTHLPGCTTGQRTLATQLSSPRSPQRGPVGWAGVGTRVRHGPGCGCLTRTASGWGGELEGRAGHRYRLRRGTGFGTRRWPTSGGCLMYSRRPAGVCPRPLGTTSELSLRRGGQLRGESHPPVVAPELRRPRARRG